MADEGPCCGFKRKTVVMTCIGLCCLMLVVWTVVITATAEEEKDKTVTNTTANSTAAPLEGVCPLNSSLPLDRVSMALTVPKIGTSPAIKKIKIGSTKTHCKCLCQYNVTESEMLEALREIRGKGKMKKSKNNNL